MKTYSKLSRSTLILMVTCLFFGRYAVSQASSNLQSRRATVKKSTFVQSANGVARLIIQRIPNLGNSVYVDLYIDGAPVATIGYGTSYEGLLPPGRHFLSVLPTPNPKWNTPGEITLDVRSGQTYTFIADGYSGNLILVAPGGPERP